MRRKILSREFGSYMSGYFHSQIDYAASDLAEGKGELTRLWGKWLEEFYKIAYAIASYEADDSGMYDPIVTTIKTLPALRVAMAAIEEYLDPFEDVMEMAVREKVEDTKCE